MEFNVFISKTVTFWIRNNPSRPAMNRSFFFTFTCDETADWRDTISCFYSADLNLITDFFYKLQVCLIKSNIFPILDLSFKKLIF